MALNLIPKDQPSIYVIRPRWYDNLNSPVKGLIICRTQEIMVELAEDGSTHEYQMEHHCTFHRYLEIHFNRWVEQPHVPELPATSSVKLAICYELFKNQLLEDLERYGIKFFDVESIACGRTYIAIKLNKRSYVCPSRV